MSNKSQPKWPEDRKFALFLSHDIDQIYDRELFHLLATINHIRRILTCGEKGNASLALRRLMRIMFSPKAPEMDFQTILDIEAQYSFRSSFFILHDYWRGRYGARYSLKSKPLQRIVKMIIDAGGEIGVHGGYYRFNEANGYRESREALRRELGVEAVGIRNHYLRFSVPETWQAQEEAGFEYDATFGYPDRPGSREGRSDPFFPVSSKTGEQMKILELPLTVMDTTLFRNAGLKGDVALSVAWDAIESVIKERGLVSLLWHNNYFNDPEYADWEWVYRQLLTRLAERNPWCATGSEIASWWRKQAKEEIHE